VNAFRLEQLLREAARRSPSHQAIRAGEAAISYRQLDEAADRVAAALASLGVGLGDRVGLFLEKSIEAVAALYGIMRAGAAYVPIDPSSPLHRAAYIALDAGIAALISDSGRIAGMAEIDGRAAPCGLCTDAAPDGFVAWPQVMASNEPAPEPPVVDTDLAYILYTSGSTGEPKGVAISHRSSLTFVSWAHRTFELSSADVFSNHAPFHFDLSTLDLFGAAAAGGTVCLVPKDAAMFPVRLADWIREQGITVWYSVPSALTMLVRFGELDTRQLRSLRLVLFAGEVFPNPYLAGLMGAVRKARFYNLFGPTETNVCTYEEVHTPPSEGDPPISIGRACENARCHVVDESGAEITTPGVEGELIVTGSGVAQGYWGDPERTQLRFPERFTHHTGDIVEILDDSPRPRYRFVGRRDHLVKTRGYRVELGEIEAALYAHPGVAECVAVAVPDELLGNRIVAFSVSRNGDGPMESALQAHCRARLPAYMVPERIFFIGRLPRTPNDKFDRRALAERAVELSQEGER
jgi:amino acid adenylation domain-containing protein